MADQKHDEMANALRLWRYLGAEAQQAFLASADAENEEGRWSLANMLSTALLVKDSDRRRDIAYAAVPSGPAGEAERLAIKKAFGEQFRQTYVDMVLPFPKPAWVRDQENRQAAREESARWREKIRVAAEEAEGRTT